MNAIQSRMMGEAISQRMYTGYAQANDQQLAHVAARKLSPIMATRGVSKLQPTLSMKDLDPRSKTLSFEQSAFLKDYRNNMLNMQQLAAETAAGQADVRATLAAGSDNPAVAEVTGKLAEITDRYTLKVEQIATGQVSRSAPVQAAEELPTASGSLHLQTEKGSYDLYMSGAGYRNNLEMLESFADKINKQDAGVTATVRLSAPEKVDIDKVVKSIRDGEAESPEGMDEVRAVLQLESNTGGESGSFDVTGTLAEQLQIARDGESPMQEALYSILKNSGLSETFRSPSNNIAIDGGITALLKGPGTANIGSVTDAAEGTADRLNKLVGQYNDTLNFLDGNSTRGWGVQNQLRRMGRLEQSEDDLAKIGVSRERTGRLSFDRDSYLTQARRWPGRTNELVEEFTQGVQESARQGMKESSGSLVGPLEYTQRAESKQLDPVNVLSTYSKNGVYNLMNLYAAGVLMNLNA